jgi:hypothetical protein
MRRLLARAAVAVALLLGLGLSGIMCARVADRGRYATAYSTYSAGPEGARAIYELTRRSGHPTQRWVEDLQDLPDGGVLIALGGCLASQRRPLSRYERERLGEWVQAGGTLMVFGAHQYLPDDYPAHLERATGGCRTGSLQDMLAELEGATTPEQPEQPEAPAPATPAPPGEPASDEHAAAAPPAPETPSALEAGFDVWSPALDEDSEPVYLAHTREGPLKDLRGVPMSQPARVVVADGPTEQVLAVLGEQRAVSVVEWGEGRLVLAASASMLTNQNVLGHRGGVFFARLLAAHAAPAAAVVFDEFHLGTGGTRSLVRYLRQVGVGAALLQLLLLGAIWILRSGRRLGELEVPAATPPGGTVSYVAATSALYSRSPDHNGVARVLLIRALDRVATQQRIRVREPERVVEQLRALGRHEAAVATEELLRLFAEPTPTPKALLLLSKRIDALVLQASAPAVTPLEPPPS